MGIMQNAEQFVRHYIGILFCPFFIFLTLSTAHSGVCRIQGEPDGIAGAPHQYYYKDKGGLRQIQRMGVSLSSGGGRMSKDRAEKVLEDFKEQAFLLDDGGPPCLTLPQQDFDGRPHIRGAVYGHIIPVSGDIYSFSFAAYYLDFETECLDGSPDTDGDGVSDCEDKCPWTYNPDQTDNNANGVGDICEPDKYDLDFGLPANNFSCQVLQGNPINILIGNNVESETDLSFPSAWPGGLKFQRTYNSRSFTHTAMGYGWTHNYHQILYPDFIGDEKQIKIVTETGRGIYFEDNDRDGVFKGAYSEDSTITLNGDNYLWQQDDGSVSAFDKDTGRLISISDKNGNSRSLSYTPEGLLETVTDHASGRSLIFHYNADSRISHISGPVTAAVTDGIWVSYDYDAAGNLIRVTYADDNNGSAASGFEYRYEDSGDPNNMTAKYDLAGHLISTWGYDSQDRATENHHREGKGVSVAYTDDSLVTVTDAYGISSAYGIAEVAGRKQILSKTVDNSCASCSTGIVRTEFDETNGMPAEREWMNGRIDRFLDYDGNGNAQTRIMSAGTGEENTVYTTWHPDMDVPLTRTEASSLAGESNPSLNRVTTWDYDDPSGPDNTDTPNEAPTSRVYRIIRSGYTLDNAGAVTAREYVTLITYNHKGQVETVDGPLPGTGDTVTLGWDTNTGDLLSVTSPVTGTRTFEYDTAGNVIRTVDENGTVTQVAYDGRNRAVSSETGGVTFSRSFDASGSLAATIDGAGRTLDYNYNSSGFIRQILDNTGAYQYFAYDDKGNPVESSIYSSSGTRTLYRGWDYGDPENNTGLTPGKPWKILEKSADGSQILETVLAYRHGEVVWTTDPLGKVRETAYDSRNRIVLSSALQAETGPATIAYGYDKAGNLASVTDPAGNKTVYRYDDSGNLVKQVSPDSGTTLYQYNGAGRMVSKTVNSADPVQYGYDALGRLTGIYHTDSARNVTYTYDQGPNGKGRLTGVTDPSGSRAYTYDSLGRVVSEAGTLSGSTYTTSYARDGTGSLTSLTYPSGRTVTYERDTSGSITRVTSTKEGTTLVLAENITHQPFGPVDSLDYGNGKTMASTFDQRYLPATLTSGGIIDNTYTVSGSGNITGITDNQGSADQSFTFDDLYRLTHALGSYGEHVYEYGQSGNRQKKMVNSQSELYSYLPGTNQLYQVVGGTITAATRTLAFNPNGRLESISENGAVLGEYEYDSQGRRTRKTVNGTTTVYHYDLSGLLIAESGTDGTVTREYVYLDSRPLAMIVQNSGDQLYFYHNDHLGTPKALTDMTGTVVWQASHAPFGKAVVTVNTVENNLRFPGQYFDGETGLHYNWHRYYDPMTGRYLTPDPIGLAGGINPFVYSLNNPINYIDPLGLNTTTFPGTPGLPIGGLPGTVFEPGSHPNDLFVRDITSIIGLMDPRPLIDDIINLWNEKTEDGESCDNNRHSPDQQALNDLIDEQTLGGRKPLSEEEVDTILDWGEELGIDGVRDDRGKDHWKGGDHIHVPGSGIGHIPAN
ncbi:MAG: DUF6531 domain-containing protein [Desulfobacterales bacterium]|nr:DUF6531 domain-containing protein [Desulfobacterales bacterium]